MASELLQKFGSGVTLTISLASLANAAGRISDVIDNTTVRAPMAFLSVRVMTGGTAPSNNFPVKVYLIRRSNLGTDISDHNLGVSDAAVSAEPVGADLIGVINVGTGINTQYDRVFVLYDLPAKYSIVVWNAIGQALHGTAGNHILQIVPVTIEAQ